MTSLSDKPSRDEVMEKAGFSDMQMWYRFIDITKGEARKMLEAKAGVRWGKVPYNEKCEIMDRINTALVSEGIPAVTLEVVSYRMSRALTNLKQQEARSSKPPAGTAAGAADHGTNASVDELSAAAIPPDTHTASSLPWDPVKGE